MRGAKTMGKDNYHYCNKSNEVIIEENIKIINRKTKQNKNKNTL